MRWLLFFILVAIQIAVIWPRFRQTCNNSNQNVKQIGLFLTHHFVDVYFFFGPLFFQSRREHVLHAMAIVAAVIHWLTNDNQCIWTQWLNRSCDYPDDDMFDSLKNRIPNMTSQIHYVWIAGLLLWDFKQF